MAAAIKEGDRVQIVARSTTAEDAKSSLYYAYFSGLTGTVQKVYETDEAAIEVELDALPEGVAQRHNDVQEAMKTRWLEGLSEEGRNRLTDQERAFRLRYTVLVATRDIVAAAPRALEPDKPARRTEADLAAAEEVEIQRRRQPSS